MSINVFKLSGTRCELISQVTVHLLCHSNYITQTQILRGFFDWILTKTDCSFIKEKNC